VWFQAAGGKAIRYTVGTTLPTESEIISSDLVLVSSADFKRLLLIPDRNATDPVVNVKNPGELRTIAEKIARHLP
jgi:hypothetical protein